MGGADNGGMIGQSEIVVGAHVDHGRTTVNADFRLLGASNLALAFEEAGLFDGGDFLKQEWFYIFVRGVLAILDVDGETGEGGLFIS
jgi:hypothetical protein